MAQFVFTFLSRAICHKPVSPEMQLSMQYYVIIVIMIKERTIFHVSLFLHRKEILLSQIESVICGGTWVIRLILILSLPKQPLFEWLLKAGIQSILGIYARPLLVWKMANAALAGFYSVDEN